MTCEVFPLKEHCLTFRAGRYLAATCIILQELRPFVNSFSEKKSQKIPHHRRASQLYGECGIPASIYMI